MNNELRDKVIEILIDVYDRQAQVCEAADEIIDLVEHSLSQQKGTEPVDLDAAPIGTTAPATGGGHWIKTERGWKWCTGATFSRPGGDWNGKLHPPKPAAQPQVPMQVTDGGRNELYEGLFDDETARERDDRLRRARAAQPQVPEGIVEKYNELLYHVARKFPNESRHETALRYIKNAESAESYCAAAKEEGK